MPGSFQTPLHMAAKNGEMALVCNILEIMTKEKIICQFDDFENSPIHEAARFGELVNCKMSKPARELKHIKFMFLCN